MLPMALLGVIVLWQELTLLVSMLLYAQMTALAEFHLFSMNVDAIVVLGLKPKSSKDNLSVSPGKTNKTASAPT